MFKRNIKLISVLFGVMFFLSCKKDISLQPIFFQPVTFTTEAQLVNQLVGVYAPLQQDVLYGQGMWGYFEGGADESFRNGTNASTVFTELYNIASAETNIGNHWRQLYNGVERANVIIDAASRITMDTSKRANIVGQAKFLRAFYYYILESRYGGVEGIPIKEKLSTEMGTDFNIPRTAGKQVYDFIIQEMAGAEAMVPAITAPQSWQSSAPTSTVVSKSAIQAMLARVCLSAAGQPINDKTRYAQALSWSKKLISTGIHQLNTTSLEPGTPAYARVFINNMQNNSKDRNVTEGIWDAAFLSKSNATGAFANTGYLVTQSLGAIMGVFCPDATAGSIMGFGSGTYRPHNKLYNLYKSGDLRRDWAIAPYMYKTNGSTSRFFTMTVGFTGGNGTGAAATAYVNANGTITNVVIDNPGFGYTVAPTISFTGFATNTTTAPVGTGAVATATVSGGRVTAINVTNGGTGFPTVYDRCVGKWRREYEVNLPSIRLQNNTSSNFPIIRYADVLLMAAEADLMVNGAPTADGLLYYNMVRRRAYGLDPMVPAPSLDVTTFNLQDIMDERSRELCFEGVRRMDLLRWGTMTDVMQKLLAEVNTAAPTGYRFAAGAASTNYLQNPAKFNLFPIPSAVELAQNLGLTQNTGW